MNTKYVLLISALIATLCSALITIIPIGIYNQADVSAFFPTLFTPAPFTFSIWSIIYLSWIALWIHEAFGKSWISKDNAYLLASAQILSSLWLIPSQFLWIWTSLIVMFGVLYLLSLSFILSRKENIYFRYTVELFWWWIIVACIANTHLFLVASAIYYMPEILTYISIALALGINILLIQRYNIFIPALVSAWAWFGIYIWQGILTIRIFGIMTSLILVALILYTYQEKMYEYFQIIKNYLYKRKK